MSRTCLSRFLLLCLGMALALPVLTTAANADSVTVPDVVGKTEIVAQDMIETDDLVAKITYVNNPAIADGIVVSQHPGAGASMLEQGIVTIQVNQRSGSTSGGVVTVPNLVGLTFLDAMRALGDAGLTADPTLVGAARAGAVSRVISQSPLAGSRLASGSTVLFSHAVPAGSAPLASVIVPNFIGMSASAAHQLALDEGLSPLLAGPSGVSTSTGVISSQTPGAGSSVPRSTQVHLQYAAGSSTVGGIGVVPNFVGMTEGQVMAAGRAANLSMRLTRIPVGTGLVPRARSQDIAAGTRVASWTQVTVDFSGGGSTGTTGVVPDFVGMTEAQARTAAATAGVSVTFGAVASWTDPRIQSQDVPAGTPALGRSVALDFNGGGTAGGATVLPDFTGWLESRVRDWAANNGVVLGTSSIIGSVAGVRRVAIGQTPAAGTPVTSVARLDVKIGNEGGAGSASAADTIADLTGMTQTEAQAYADQEGLILTITPSSGTRSPRWVVKSQVPAAGTPLASNVSLFVVMEAGPVLIPTIGATETAFDYARRLRVLRLIPVFDPAKRWRHPTSTTPPEGSQVAENSSVQVNIP